MATTIAATAGTMITVSVLSPKTIVGQLSGLSRPKKDAYRTLSVVLNFSNALQNLKFASWSRHDGLGDKHAAATHHKTR